MRPGLAPDPHSPAAASPARRIDPAADYAGGFPSPRPRRRARGRAPRGLAPAAIRARFLPGCGPAPRPARKPHMGRRRRRAVAYESRLPGNNPWWEDPAAIDADPDIVKWEASRVRRVPPLLRRMRLGSAPDGTAIHVLGGPRGGGQDHPDEAAGARPPARGGPIPGTSSTTRSTRTGGEEGPLSAVEEYAGHREEIWGGKGERYAFLDEVTSAPEWREELEELVRGAALFGFTVVASGSGPAGGAARPGALPRPHRGGRAARPTMWCGPWGSPGSRRCATGRSARA